MPRRIEKKVAVDELVASIEAHGLLQSLTVVGTGDGKYRVSAGGRRLAALKLLAERKTIPADFAVPCMVVPADIAEETSLAENIQRVTMHLCVCPMSMPIGCPPSGRPCMAWICKKQSGLHGAWPKGERHC